MTGYIQRAIDLLGSYKTKYLPATLDIKETPEGLKSVTVPGLANDIYEKNEISKAPQYMAFLVGGLILVTAYKIFWKK